MPAEPISAGSPITFYALTWRKNGETFTPVSGSAVLSGRYQLTAAELARRHIDGSIVLLHGPAIDGNSLRIEELFSMPNSFIEAGARGVLAVPATVSDIRVGQFLTQVIVRVQAGEALPAALRNERMEWLRNFRALWVNEIAAYE